MYRPVFLVAGVLSPAIAAAQASQPPVSRLDLTVSTGWFAADRSASTDCCNSTWSSGLFKGVSAGYYWTDHLKTEVGSPRQADRGLHGFSEQALPNGRHELHVGGAPDRRHQGLDRRRFTSSVTTRPSIPSSSAASTSTASTTTIERYISIVVFEQQHRGHARGNVDPRATVRRRRLQGVFHGARVLQGRGPIRRAAKQRSDQMTWTAGVGIDLGGGSGTQDRPWPKPRRTRPRCVRPNRWMYGATTRPA